jgi:hypothetical protein
VNLESNFGQSDFGYVTRMNRMILYSFDFHAMGGYWSYLGWIWEVFEVDLGAVHMPLQSALLTQLTPPPLRGIGRDPAADPVHRIYRARTRACSNSSLFWSGFRRASVRR